VALGTDLKPDLAFVDIHLADGPTGVDVARRLTEGEVTVLFMTANAKRIPDDCAGARGVIGKPYTERGVIQALDYVTTEDAAFDQPPERDNMTFVPFERANGGSSRQA
jgi:two-component SAPR family response regulator